MTYEIPRNTKINGKDDFGLEVIGNTNIQGDLTVTGSTPPPVIPDPLIVDDLTVNVAAQVDGTLDVVGITTLPGTIDGDVTLNTGSLNVMSGGVSVDIGNVTVNAGNLDLFGGSSSISMPGANTSLLMSGLNPSIVLSTLGGAGTITLNGRAVNASPMISLVNDVLSFENTGLLIPMGFGPAALQFNSTNSPFTFVDADDAIEISENGEYIFAYTFLLTGSGVAAADSYQIQIAEGPPGGPWIAIGNTDVSPVWNGTNNEKQGNAYYRSITVAGQPRSFQMRFRRVTGAGSIFAFQNESTFTVRGPY